MGQIQAVFSETLISRHSSLAPLLPKVHTFHSICLYEKARAKEKREEVGQVPVTLSSARVHIPTSAYLPAPWILKKTVSVLVPRVRTHTPPHNDLSLKPASPLLQSLLVQMVLQRPQLPSSPLASAVCHCPQQTSKSTILVSSAFLLTPPLTSPLRFSQAVLLFGKPHSPKSLSKCFQVRPTFSPHLPLSILASSLPLS